MGGARRKVASAALVAGPAFALVAPATAAGPTLVRNGIVVAAFGSTVAAFATG